mmetsp:Transcript_7214/g.9251  ORF Transcript_7214/g.9251 Transcript_7214/m.9251 type:complete len:104 (+) Transcript_7214:2-313(+)
MATRIYGISVGLFAHFGPYVVQISALFLGDKHAEEICLIKPGVNFLSMEIISMLPPRCDGVLLLAWGEPTYYWDCDYRKSTWSELKESDYKGMKLVLNQYIES